MSESQNTHSAQNWIRDLYEQKKGFERWAAEEVKELWEGRFQMSYLYLLLLIDPKGSTHKELLQRSTITSANLSRAIQILTDMGLVKSQISKFDRRSYPIFLTQKGQEITTETLQRFEKYTQVNFNSQSVIDGFIPKIF